jgi:CBS domain-containing protein
MHPAFDQPVVTYMNRQLEVARLDTPADDIARTLAARRISGVPIVDDRRRIVGVVSRTDLIRLGLLQTGRRPSDPAMSLPHKRASDVMTHRPTTVPSSVPLHRAARAMIDFDIHRVFVTEGDGALAGVICAVDVAAAVRDARIDRPVSSIMTSPIVTIDVHQPLSIATELLDRVHVTGLIVTDNGHPIGMFTQTDALASRERPRSTPVEDVYDAAVICLPADMKLARVAAHVTDAQIRRVVVCKMRDPVGIVTAMDFARFVAL